MSTKGLKYTNNEFVNDLQKKNIRCNLEGNVMTAMKIIIKG